VYIPTLYIKYRLHDKSVYIIRDTMVDSATSDMLVYCSCCKAYKCSTYFTSSRLARKIKQCKSCKSAYDKQYKKKQRKIDNNIVRLRKYLSGGFVSKEKINQVISRETLLKLFRDKEINIDNYETIKIFPPVKKSDKLNLKQYQIVCF